MPDTTPPESLRARREAQRRPVVRRRGVLAIVVILAVGGALVAVVLSSGSSPAGRLGAAAPSASGGANAGRGHGGSELVRNASPQPGWKPFTGPVPILVYHALGTPPPSEAYPGLYVSDSEFRSEISWVARHGYQAVTLDEVEQAWYHHGTLPDKPIVITFDNGYPAQVQFAPKVLDKYGWPGVLFEITVGHLTPVYIKPVIAKGWEIDSHSATHPDLTTLSGSALAYQVAGSSRFLKRTFHVPSNNFCYPSSLYNAATVAAVRAAGYTGGVTETPGYASRDRPFELSRFEIEGGQGVAGLASDLGSK